MNLVKSNKAWAFTLTIFLSLVLISGTKENLLNVSSSRYLFYDVNPSEGFNLRRDVYLRLAVFVHNTARMPGYENLKLVLPPWTNLYHWQSVDIPPQKFIPWSHFFDMDSLKKFSPVIELHEVFEKEKPLIIDTLYEMNYVKYLEDDDIYSETVKIDPPSKCRPNLSFWGYSNITYTKYKCLNFQARAFKLKEVLDFDSSERKIMISNGELAMHDEYGTKLYWKGRQSMKFKMELINIAEEFIASELNCFNSQCDNYVAVHWRRGDFAKSRSREVPSVHNTSLQIHNQILKRYQSLIKTVFIATDAHPRELNDLLVLLLDFGYTVKGYSPSKDVKVNIGDGGVAIVDQIICSHAAYFIGTHESTFTFRIQEERELLRFDSKTTFNRLCPDFGDCERMSRWKYIP